MLRLTLILLLLLAAPAGAAERFVGVLTDGRVVRFTDEAPTALTTPKRVSGLLPGDRIVALAPDHALGRSGTFYIFNSRTLRVTRTTARLELRGENFTLAVMPDRRFVHVFSDTGQHLVVDAANFSVSPGQPLRLQDGTPLRPAVTALTDGRLSGVDPNRGTLVTETAPGSGVATEVRLANAREDRLELTRPLAYTGAAGRGYLLAGLPSRRHRQSRLIRVDLTTGRTTGEAGPYFFRQIVAFAPLGAVADDRTPPRISWTSVPRQVSLRDLARDGGVRFSVRCSEGCQVVGSSGVGGRSNAGVLVSRDTPGTVTIRLNEHGERELRLMRFRLGKTIKLRVFVRDWVGNSRVYDRNVRLVR